MKSAGKNNLKSNIYEGVGHLIDLPFSPPTTLSNHAMFPKPLVLQMGGDDIIKHGKAQESIWSELIDYFNAHLR